jgi:transcriptional regulator with XRE-family HTH domain
MPMNSARLNRIMASHELRQLDLAELFDVTTRQVRRWQKDNAAIPAPVRVLLHMIERDIVSVAQVREFRDKPAPRRRSGLTAAIGAVAMAAGLLLHTPVASAQDAPTGPSEEAKRSALLKAYRLNDNSMVRWGSIDMTQDVDCRQVEGGATGAIYFECFGYDVDHNRIVEIETVPRPAKAASAKPTMEEAPQDVCQRHGLHKVTRGSSWRCKP